VLAGLQVALAIRVRRAPPARHLARVVGQQVRVLAALAMIAIVVIALVNLSAGKAKGSLFRALTGRGRPRQHTARVPHLTTGSADASYVVYAVIALLVLAAIVVTAIIISRMRYRISGGYAAEATGDDSDELRKAVESGAAALRTVDDARAAIIACYVAMEGSLASAGSARTAAETPDELLAKAVAAGLLHGPAAAALTRLFYEARFSSHQLPDAAKLDARQALDAISGELRGRTVAGQAAR